MRIEHIALYVNDLEAAREFYCRYFDGQSGERYHNPKTRFQSYFLRFAGGARLELMTAPEMEDAPKAERGTGYSHLAFSVGSRQAVDALTERLKEDGHPVVSGPRVTGDGYYESCVLDPEGNRIEITE